MVSDTLREPEGESDEDKTCKEAAEINRRVNVPQMSSCFVSE